MSRPEDDPSTPILLRRARNDALLLRKVVGDLEVADEIVGFHAQQTVEKSLKAVLEARGVDYPYTHDLARLFGLLDTTGGGPQGDRDHALALSPWAAELRYGDVVASSLDRERAVAIAEAILAWSQHEVVRRATRSPR